MLMQMSKIPLEFTAVTVCNAIFISFVYKLYYYLFRSITFVEIFKLSVGKNYLPLQSTGERDPNDRFNLFRSSLFSQMTIFFFFFFFF